MKVELVDGRLDAESATTSARLAAHRDHHCSHHNHSNHGHLNQVGCSAGRGGETPGDGKREKYNLSHRDRFPILKEPFLIQKYIYFMFIAVKI